MATPDFNRFARFAWAETARSSIELATSSPVLQSRVRRLYSTCHPVRSAVRPLAITREVRASRWQRPTRRRR